MQLTIFGNEAPLVKVVARGMSTLVAGNGTAVAIGGMLKSMSLSSDVIVLLLLVPVYAYCDDTCFNRRWYRKGLFPISLLVYDQEGARSLFSMVFPLFFFFLWVSWKIILRYDNRTSTIPLEQSRCCSGLPFLASNVLLACFCTLNFILHIVWSRES